MTKCKDCGKTHNGKNKLCDSCSKRARDAVEKRRNILFEKGLCCQCGKNNKLPDKVRCQSCHDKLNIAGHKRMAAYKKQKRCTTCGNDMSNVLAWHTGRCPGCHLKYKFAFTGTKEEAEKLINDMLTNQNFKCALTGRCLRTNKFHIDHIVPRSIGGLNDASNLQLIVDEANVFKTNLSMEQVIILAKDIVEKARNDGKL